MTSKEQILSTLMAILHERFAIKTEQFSHASRLSDIGIDSLHLVDIMLDMETEFGFRFESLRLPRDPSLDQITQAIIGRDRASS